VWESFPGDQVPITFDIALAAGNIKGSAKCHFAGFTRASQLVDTGNRHWGIRHREFTIFSPEVHFS